MLRSNTFLKFRNLQLKFSDKYILDDISGNIQSSDKVGLIGLNGSGKTTFLKVLAGITKPTSGDLETKFGFIEYVPQLDLNLLNKDEEIYLYLSKIYPDWWEVLIFLENHFRIIISEKDKVKNLSGGEVNLLNLAVASLKDPQILLLDEPTNHLDIQRVDRLDNFLQNLEIPLLVVSHRGDFLNSIVNQIWELKNGSLHIYGGNYDYYCECRKQEQDARRRKLMAKKLKLKKIKNAKVREDQRFLRVATRGRKMVGDSSTGKAAKNFLKNRSQKISGRQSKNLDKSEKKLIREIESLKLEKTIRLRLKVNKTQRAGSFLNIRNSCVSVRGRKLFNILDFTLSTKSRIAILGKNASGKSSFVKSLEYKKPLYIKPSPRYFGDYNTAYINQNYKNINLSNSLFENVLNSNQNLNSSDIRQILSGLGFKTKAEIEKKVKYLSGGEMARVSFAIAFARRKDLVVLDEPTNNIDLYSKEIIVNALLSYSGALVIVSHDIQFLEGMEIQEYWIIHNQKLHKFFPSRKEDIRAEILNFYTKNNELY